MRLARPLALIIAATLCAAGSSACFKKPADPVRKSILVKWRLNPGAVTRSSPKKDFRCVAYRIEVVNRGYDSVDFDRGAFTLDVEGKPWPSADLLACVTAEAANPAKLTNGQFWKGTVAFEQPIFTLDARVLLKPAAVKDGLFGSLAMPVIEYQIASGN